MALGGPRLPASLPLPNPWSAYRCALPFTFPLVQNDLLVPVDPAPACSQENPSRQPSLGHLLDCTDHSPRTFHQEAAAPLPVPSAQSEMAAQAGHGGLMRVPPLCPRVDVASLASLRPCTHRHTRRYLKGLACCGSFTDICTECRQEAWLCPEPRGWCWF